MVLLAAGVLALDRGADWFADAATGLARHSGLPLTVVGLLTVGVEWEELAVVVVALVRGEAGLALGALVGSAIANLTLAMAVGLAAGRVHPGIHDRLLGTILLFGTTVFVLLAQRDRLSALSGLVLLVVFAAYVIWLLTELRSGLRSRAADGDDEEGGSGRLALVLAGGLLLALVGGELVVRGALRLAGGFGLPEAVVGLTLVALGTSLPDLAVSFTAARRGAGSLVIANAAGSNLCNLLLLPGIVALVAPGSLPAGLRGSDLAVLLAVTATFASLLYRPVLGRPVAVLLGAVYLLYIGVRLL